MVYRLKCGFLRWGLLPACLLSMGAATAAPLRVGFLCPAPAETPFWAQVIQVMEAAAVDLGIDLVVKCSQRGTLATKRTGIEFLNSQPKLDYFISGYWSSVTKYHLELAEEKGIKVFIINANVAAGEVELVGEPRQKFPNWIGHMIPDDKAASSQLINLLIDRARFVKKKGSSEKIDVFAFMGEGTSPVAANRNAGLKEVLDAIPNANLHAFSGDNWIQKWVEEETEKLWESYSNIDVIWAGNETTAWGALLGVERAGKVAGRDVIIGGFDWNSESIKAIADGRITASMVGHFIEGAWSLVLVHDHYHGFDFANINGVRIFTPLTPVNAGNHDSFAFMRDKKFWEDVDFREFSRKYNRGLGAYNFNINQFLNVDASAPRKSAD